MEIQIVAIRYLEPDYKNTIECINNTKIPVIWVDRNPIGVGSLAEAINRGVSQATSNYVWIVTNITFEKNVPEILFNTIGDADAIHPRFNSDHRHISTGFGVMNVPFIEFTAAFINRNKWIGLDENLEYWGHDLDHGYKVHKNGGHVKVNYDLEVGHTYIRNSKPHPITRERQRLRKLADRPTSEYLRKKYGSEWRVKLYPRVEKEISKLYQEVSEQIQPQPEKLALIDFDGVLTDGKYYLNHKGEKLFYSLHARDNAAIAELISKGYQVTIITANDSPIIQEYAKQRKCEYLYSRDKAINSEIAIGDSCFDIPMLKMAKKAYCPSNADSEVLKIKGIKVLPVKGGEGVISELIRHL